jgi:hypothetical protein
MAPSIGEYAKRLTSRNAALLIIVLFSLVLRVVLAFGCTAAPDFSDMETYNLLALEGGISVVPPPGYPLFLRLIYTIFGPRNYLAVFIVQGIVSALTVGLIFLVSERIANFRTAVIAASVSAVYPNFLVYNLTTMSETLGLFLAVLLIWFLVSDLKENLKAVGGALLLVVSCAVRPVLIYFWPGMLLSLKKKLLFVLATALLVTPWVIYSASTGQVTNRPGRAFYKTYNPKSNGKQYVKFSETELSREDLPNGVYFREAFDFIANNKWKTLDIIYNKTAMIFSRGWDQHFMQGVVGEGNKWLFLMIYSFTPFMLLGMAGLIMYIGGENRILAYLLISYLVAFVFLAIFKVRYRLLVEPIFIIYSAIFIDRTLSGDIVTSEKDRGEVSFGKRQATESQRQSRA